MPTAILRLALMVAVVNSQLPTPNSQGEPAKATGRKSPQHLHVGGLFPVHDKPFPLGVGSCPPSLVAHTTDKLWRGLAEARVDSHRAKAEKLGVDQEQPSKIKPSQHGTVSQRINETTITVVYNRPVARGRELFGKLVPFGRIWCPCADDATTVEVSTDVKVDGQELPAGKYSLWTEPNQERWTVMFNKNHAVWHTRYPEGQDALRLQVSPRIGSHMEAMAFYFPVVDGRKAELVLHWGTTVVPMGIEVP